jgi:hypothetical protein
LTNVYPNKKKNNNKNNKVKSKPLELYELAGKKSNYSYTFAFLNGLGKYCNSFVSSYLLTALRATGKKKLNSTVIFDFSLNK